MRYSSIPSERSTRVLFLAWGFSIHAKRRIQIFLDDPSFEVAVVSTYDYNFPDAKNVLLSGLHGKKRDPGASYIVHKRGEAITRTPGIMTKALRRMFDKIEPLLDNIRMLCSPVFLGDIGIWIRNHRTFFSFLSSEEVRTEKSKAIKDFKKLKHAVQQFKPHVVFLQTLMYPCYLAYFLPKSIPLVITFWNGDVTWWAQWTGIERLLKKHLVRYGVRRAKGITVNSQKAFNACRQYGAKADRIHLIRYPGVDSRLFKPIAKDEAKRKLGITAKKVVLCPRGLSQYLNSDIIVQAAATVTNRYPDSLFVFVSGVGGLDEVRKHKEQAYKLGIDNNLRWDGQVPWEIMPLYYNSSDVMVSISSNDSLPNCMLEAMACGTPIIMGDIPQIREWVADGVNGFLVPTRNPDALAEKITEVFERPYFGTESFTEKNAELLKLNFNYERNIGQIKNLVRLVGTFHKNGESPSIR